MWVCCWSWFCQLAVRERSNQNPFQQDLNKDNINPDLSAEFLGFKVDHLSIRCSSEIIPTFMVVSGVSHVCVCVEFIVFRLASVLRKVPNLTKLLGGRIGAAGQALNTGVVSYWT